MSFLYPNRIRILRPISERSLGAGEYSGQRRRGAEHEECIAEDVQASIQMKKEAQRPEGQLPGDAVRRTLWQVMIPRGELPDDVSIRLRDIIEDEKTRQRYQVLGPYLTGLGHQLLAELLEV